MSNDKTSGHMAETADQCEFFKKLIQKFPGNEAVAAIMTNRVSVEVTSLPCADILAETTIRILLHQQAYAADLKKEDLALAFNALVYTRILQANQATRRGKCLDHKNVLYPAFLRPILMGIGNIDQPEEGLDIRVQPSDELRAQFEGLEESDWQKIDDTLRSLYEVGLPVGMEFAEALPRQTQGMLNVLLLIADSTQVLQSTRKVAPADLMIRSVLGLNIINNIFGSPRWRYNTLDFYRNSYISFISLGFRS